MRKFACRGENQAGTGLQGRYQDYELSGQRALRPRGLKRHISKVCGPKCTKQWTGFV